MQRKSTHNVANDITADIIKSSKGGNPPKFIKYPKLRAHLIELAGQGNYLTVIAKAAGIKHSVLSKWLSLGRQYYGLQARDDHTTTTREQDYVDFFLEFTSSEAEAERTLVERWHTLSADSGDHKPIEAFLAKRYPERWGKKAHHNTPAARQVVVHITAETMSAAKDAVDKWEKDTFSDEETNV